MIKHPTGAYTGRQADENSIKAQQIFPSASVEALWCWILLGGPVQVSPLFRISLQIVASGHHCFSNFLPSESIQNIFPLWQLQCFFHLLSAEQYRCSLPDQSCFVIRINWGSPSSWGVLPSTSLSNSPPKWANHPFNLIYQLRSYIQPPPISWTNTKYKHKYKIETKIQI